MSSPATTKTPSGPGEELERYYLTAIRQRFKAEVNRLTGGAMRRMLGAHPQAEDLAFLLSYVYAHAWLRRDVPARYRAAAVAPFRSPARAFLMDLLVDAEDAAHFLRGSVRQLLAAADSLRERQQVERLLAAHGGDAEQLVAAALVLWRSLGVLERGYDEAYRDIARAERARYRGMLGDDDRVRLALVDALPTPPGPVPPFAKLAVIPGMGCPQSCRHCMFVWRPPMQRLPDPGDLYRLVASLTDSVLFTGGDLAGHLHHFARAIREMRQVHTFAILLNGDFATDLPATERVLGEMAAAVRARPCDWPLARVLLQVSFDEFHQEVVPDGRGGLRERIPVAKIANILECVPRHDEIQLCLVHKQTALNFSMDLFRHGVFGRLAAELGRRGHQLQLLAAAPSTRLKRDPLDPARMARVLKDASLVLSRHPDRPILVTSSTIDAYGRAQLLDPGEAVHERDLLTAVLAGATPRGEAFDTDLMFWHNGWVTLFAAVHVCLGNVYEESADVVLARHRKDPLTAALHAFDRRLLDLYAEVRDDLQERIARATSPHHLFHALTEEAAVRLHMTRRLIGRA